MIWRRPSSLGKSARHRGLLLLVALLSCVLLVGGTYVAVSDYLNGPSPSAVVSDYFSALARGDAPAALSYGTVPTGTHAYLTSAVLRQQLQIASIGQFTVTSVSSSDHTARVDVHYELHYQRGALNVDDTVPLVRRSNRWWLVNSAVVTKVSLAEAQRRAALAGTAFPTGPVALFPGALPITFDTANLQMAMSTAVVHFLKTNVTGLTVTVSPEGVAAVRTSVGNALRDCLSGSAVEALCPVPGGTQRAVPGTLRGTLVSAAMPGLDIGVSPDVNGVVTVGGFVDVTGRYQSLDFDNVASPLDVTDINVPISAECYATSVGSLSWQTKL